MRAAGVILVGGHESGAGADLTGLTDHPVSAAGRPLTTRLTAAPADEPVCLVPMTLGRDPELIVDTARAARWAVESGRRVCVSEPFGTATHLIGWLRAAMLPVPAESAVLIIAPAAGPHDDAELFRIARLAGQYGSRRLVEVAFAGGEPDVAGGIDRCHRLGAERVSVVPAAFGTPGGAMEPLLTRAAVDAVIAARVAAAVHRFAHSDNGIHAASHAGDGHGYAHSHAFDHAHTEGAGHAHEHAVPAH